MKYVWKRVILCLSFAVLMSCGGGNPLEGVWKGNIEGEDIEFAFFSDSCFMSDEQYYVDYSKYSYLNEEGILRLETEYGNVDFHIKIKGDTLTLTFDIDNPEGTSFDLVKVKAPKAHPAINGGWGGPDGMFVGFLHDKVYYLDEDHDADYGTYTFQGGSGSINSRLYHYELDFTVKGNTLTVTDEDLTFTRIK